MKIGNPLDLYRTGSPAGGAASADAENTKTKGPVSPLQQVKPEESATVKLSGGIDALNAGGNIDPAFDVKRVEQLKAVIADGAFKVNAEVVADKVISSNLEALSRAKP